MSNATYRNHQHYIDEGWSNEPKETFKSLLNILKKRIGEDCSSVLDVGCAAGELLGFLSTEFKECELVGVDVTQSLLDVGSRLLPEAQFTRASALELPASLFEKFDLVTSIGCMSIFNELEINVYWDNLYRVTKPGGLIVVLSPLNEFGVDAMIRHRKRPDGSPGSWETGWNIFSRETIEELVADLGARLELQRFQIPFDIPRREDPIRTWTMQTQYRDLQLTNGLKIMIDHYFMIVHKPQK
ncbi:class I SAM-dependent methyltransferase [Thalassospira sp. A40-3]|uniref:class I SAM-dependent methyltransferase n=1 Tax=Thalassospira sp. A40-3 TaxID=2785908 RepID=UPI0018CFA57A|nr:class I SAM-dependent methyltransferase [Thalassospira sp. A40-3]QPO11198.1 class I SAM-dependent methyltransferase [Thalassospira sp. A40-3]